MQRSIDAPEQVWSDVTQAAAWLGLSVREFRSEVKARPELLPFTKIGKSHRWHWLDLVCYAHYRRRSTAGKPEELDEDD